MNKFTVFYKAQVNEVRFLSSTTVEANDKEDAARRVMCSALKPVAVTSIILDR